MLFLKVSTKPLYITSRSVNIMKTTAAFPFLRVPSVNYSFLVHPFAGNCKPYSIHITNLVV